jgi:hypothetical protein
MKLKYKCIETKCMPNGKKTIKKVFVNNGKGYKSVTKFKKGKRTFSIKKTICKSHMNSIHAGKFIPGLFKDCKQ